MRCTTHGAGAPHSRIPVYNSVERERGGIPVEFFIFFIFSLSLPASSHFLLLDCFCWACFFTQTGSFSRSSFPFASHLGFESDVRRLRFCLGQVTVLEYRNGGNRRSKAEDSGYCPLLFLFPPFFFPFTLSIIISSGVGHLPLPPSHSPFSLCFYFLLLDQIIFFFPYFFLFFLL
ncbi:hypothetical protein HOY80DRAFT_102524 [Tuber brumale]|nr:hypothetical protein HOY80DRAFT_102524 [Tuber brumale]